MDHNEFYSIQNAYLDLIDFDSLPLNWHFSKELECFSRTKTLYDYQKDAIRNAIKLLYYYYEELENYTPDESNITNLKRKEGLTQLYLKKGIGEEYFSSLTFDVSKLKPEKYELLSDYYQFTQGKLNFVNFINRAGFWMATGSGKTLVIIKLIEILYNLIEKNEIPNNNILVLTYRDDLIKQLKKHVDEFNNDENSVQIKLIELNKFAEAQDTLHVSSKPTVIVYYYKSINIVDEKGIVRLDFKRFENDGNWYILLDEAHKGDKQYSKGQLIYSILSRNGFLFNFSATFTDLSDRATTVYNINLYEYLKRGYGKIIIPLEKMLQFKEKIINDFNYGEKRRIVLENLILFTAIKKILTELKSSVGDIRIKYHMPLLVVYCNSVNIEDSDLEQFFKILIEVARQELTDDFNEAKKVLINKLKSNLDSMPDLEKHTHIKILENTIEEINYGDLLREVYNAESTGAPEFSLKESRKGISNNEVAIKLQTATRHFALIKINDAKKWSIDKFTSLGYTISKTPLNEAFFDELNKENSPINLLLGSRSFFEGWDTNRPNLMLFVNIGGSDAKKFVLQAIGRGVRIEPIKNKRKRLSYINDIVVSVSSEVMDKANILETLFVSATNLQAIKVILEELKAFKSEEGFLLGDIFGINTTINMPLLIPKYIEADRKEMKDIKNIPKFKIKKEQFEEIKNYIDYIGDKRIILMKYFSNTYKNDMEVIDIMCDFYSAIGNPDKYILYQYNNYTSIESAIGNFINYIQNVKNGLEDIKNFNELNIDDIEHYKKIRIFIEEKDKSMLSTIRGKIKSIKNDNLDKETLELINNFNYNNTTVKIQKLLNHYYNPFLVPDNENVDFLTHIIKFKSEIDFINSLIEYVNNSLYLEKEFDSWLFSRLEPTDNIYIPYYNRTENKWRKFIPDFIFWFSKGNKYLILFVDPKSIEYAAYTDKVEGFKRLFLKSDKHSEFNYNGKKVFVDLRLGSSNEPHAASENLWFNITDPEKIFDLAKELLN
ncbi:MAG: DEAD/DEAH box helicase family protein [Candidatus Parvarchaeum sp.]